MSCSPLAASDSPHLSPAWRPGDTFLGHVCASLVGGLHWIKVQKAMAKEKNSLLRFYKVKVVRSPQALGHSDDTCRWVHPLPVPPAGNPPLCLRALPSVSVRSASAMVGEGLLLRPPMQELLA